MRLLIKNGYVLDPASNTEGLRDILIEDGIIKKVEEGLAKKLFSGAEPKVCCEKADTYRGEEDGGIQRTDEAERDAAVIIDQVLDATGCHVMPGFVDLHVHLREPGFEYKETVKSGTRAAAAGGYTTIAAMPNTKPVIDRAERVEHFLSIVKRDATVKVLPIGAVTLDQEGAVLTDADALKKAGVCALSEDGKSVMDTRLYREGMEKAKNVGLVVFAHCEDRDLLQGGVVNKGAVAARLQMPGISNTVEDHITIRDILLSMELDARLHLCHCSTELSVDLIKLAKQKNAKLSAEVCPHHFSLTEDDILTDDANYKMNPPLRTKKDVDALLMGLKDGTIDVIATDHAPHSREEKQQSIRTAPFGIVGSETAYALSVTNLVRSGVLSYMELVEKMSYNPARILGLDKKDGRGTLRPGAVADLVITDSEEKWIIDPERFLSKGKNSPFGGSFVYGRVKVTLVDGEIVYSDIS